MPSNVIKSFAEKAKKSVSEVEQLWDETKEEAAKKFKKGSPKFWAYVNKTTQYKLGLALKEQLSFKKFLLIEQAIVKGDKVQLIKKIKGLDDATVGEVFTVKEVDEDGNILIDNPFGIEWQDKYLNVKLFKLISD